MLLAAFVTLLPSYAAAKSKSPKFVESKHVADKPTVSLDPARAYVLLRSDAAVPLYLMRVPSEQDQATYTRLRADALAESRAKYAKKLASYEAAKTATPTAGVSAAGAKQPEPPVEPTEANFQFTPFGQMAAVAIGPTNRFAKGAGGASTYLEEVTPGRYRVYGLLLAGQNGQMLGSCFCMGSVSFDAQAGAIVDLGVIGKPEATDAPSGLPEALALRASAAGTVDPRLAKATVVPARYRPVGKLPNYFGVTITRLPEMPGVMRYDRDRIVDLTGG